MIGLGSVEKLKKKLEVGLRNFTNIWKTKKKKIVVGEDLYRLTLLNFLLNFHFLLWIRSK